MLARAGRCTTLRIIAATLTALAAAGWFAARLDHPNPDRRPRRPLGIVAVPLLIGLWTAEHRPGHKITSSTEHPDTTDRGSTDFRIYRKQVGPLPRLGSSRAHRPIGAPMTCSSSPYES